jgi:hypothetical protein
LLVVFCVCVGIFDFDFVDPVVRGKHSRPSPPAAIHPPRRSGVVLDVLDPNNTLIPSNDDDEKSVVRAEIIDDDILWLLRGRQMATVVGGLWNDMTVRTNKSQDKESPL